MDDAITLKTFQSVTRVEELRFCGVLVGRWESVTRGWEASYRRMIAEMARRGIDCEGRPPMWAWARHVTWGDAFGLLDEATELSLGYATITFRAPADLVLLSEYGPWSDALGAGEWTGTDARAGLRRCRHRT